MSRSSLKPKATIIWKEQTEKLKQRLASLADRDLYFEQGKMDEMFARLRGEMGKTHHEVYEILSKM